MTAAPYGENIIESPLYVGVERRAEPREPRSEIRPEVLGCAVLDLPRVQPEVRTEVCELLVRGYDAAIVSVDDPQFASPLVRLEMDNRAEALAAASDGAEIFRSWPAMRVWAPLTMRAIALHPLYGAARLHTLGEGIDPHVFSRPSLILDAQTGKKQSALDLIVAHASSETAGRADAAEQLAQYQAFIKQPIDPDSRLVYQASRDGEGIRSRAILAATLARRHFAIRRTGHDIRMASLACGAAGPAFALMNSLEKDGHTVSAIDLLDLDPMSLAAAHSLGEEEGVADRLTLIRKNLLRGELTDALPANGVDMVDMLGLFEYISNRDSTQLATRLLQRAHQVVGDGGLILVGNMLANRDQQKFFNDVVRWPKLYQRTIGETLDIIDAAGLDARHTKVRISAKDGVYAVYAIPVSKRPALRLVK